MLTAAMDARDLQSRVNRMVGSLVSMRSQLESLRQAVRQGDAANAEQIRALSAQAIAQIDSLENTLRRPPPRMGYRQYPRLSEEIGFILRGIGGAQARPTAGQMETLGEVGTEVARKENELQGLLDTTIAEINRLLSDQPRILPGWSQRRIS